MSIRVSLKLKGFKATINVSEELNSLAPVFGQYSQFNKLLGGKKKGTGTMWQLWS